MTGKARGKEEECRRVPVQRAVDQQQPVDRLAETRPAV